MIDAQSCNSKMTCAYLYIGAKVDTVILRGSLSSCIAMPLQFVHSEVTIRELLLLFRHTNLPKYQSHFHCKPSACLDRCSLSQ